MDREQCNTPWDRPGMRNEGDLLGFDELSTREKAWTLLGLTIAAWALLGTAACLIYLWLNPNA